MLIEGLKEGRFHIVHAPWCPCGSGLGGAHGPGMPVVEHEMAIITPYPPDGVDCKAKDQSSGLSYDAKK